MDERMELLKMANNRFMPYSRFADYVINYILCLNDERGEEIYRYFPDTYFSKWPYVRKIKKTKTRNFHWGAI